MKKIDIIKINKSSDDIWKLLKLAVDTRNWALLEANLHRLHALQRYYCMLLTTEGSLVQILEAENAYLRDKNNELEDENIKYLCKSKGLEYQEIKNRVDKLFKQT